VITLFELRNVRGLGCEIILAKFSVFRGQKSLNLFWSFLYSLHPVSESSKPAILLIGAPGAGKGTQGEAVGHLPGYFHCASGDIFRALDKESDLGKKIAEYSKSGNLVPDEITMDIVRTQLEAWIEDGTYNPTKEILILDGIPRTENQATLIQEFVDLKRVIHLSCPDRESLVTRMKQRALDKGRADDANEGVIRNRFSVYESETKPILEHFGADKITTINAQQHPIQVLQEITKCLTTEELYQTLA